MTRPLVFLGPSLGLETARRILDADYLPPAAQGDVVSAIGAFHPSAIGLIDGVFLQDLSVWHKEILYALSEGIPVYGASSMGALRAAELDTFGMIGIGRIYRGYAGGDLLDDDEVALAYAVDDGDYQALSEPMVNIRATLATARDEGAISVDEHDAFVTVAKRLYFPERTFQRIVQEARRTLDLAPDVAERLAAHHIDQKRLDAVELLETMAAAPPGLRHTPTFEFERSSLFETLYNRDRKVVVDTDQVSLDSISDHVAVNHPAIDDLNFHALNRAVVVQLAAMLGVDVDDAETDRELERVKRRLGLDDDDATSAWLTSNHLSADELRDLACEVAICRRMHRWYTYAMWIERTSKLVLDELRLNDTYTDWARRAASQAKLLALDGQTRTSTEGWSLAQLVDEQQAYTDWKPGIDATEWAQEAGFHTVGNLKVELVREALVRRKVLSMLANTERDPVD